jgi:hypothetical protein
VTGSTQPDIYIGNPPSSPTPNNGNVVIGPAAGDAITTGGSNVIIGNNAGTANTTGLNNVFVGVLAGGSNVSGLANTAIGRAALNTNAGWENIAIGAGAGSGRTGGASIGTPTGSIFIGATARSQNIDPRNEIVIGFETTGNGDNSVTLGNTNITKTILRPNVGIGVTGPSNPLEVAGIVSASSYQGSGASLTGIVTQIVAGTNVTISPVGGTGVVTINSSGGGGGGGTSGTSGINGTSGTSGVNGTSGSSGISGSSGTSGVSPTGQIILTAAGGWPSLTNGCQPPASAQTTTNQVNFYFLGFLDGATTTYANWAMPMPSDYNGGTITAQFYWVAGNASTNSVVWGLQARSYADGDLLDQAYGTAVEVTDANQANDDVNISATTSAITIGGTPAAHNYVQFRAYRNPAAAGDTLAATAELLSIKITYTRA